MSNPIDKIPLEFTEAEAAEIAELTGEAAGELVIDRMLSYCDQIEALGLDPVIIMAALLQVYCDVSCEYGDRTVYEEQLTVALEDEWPEQWIH
jgi:hypothetical protein